MALDPVRQARIVRAATELFSSYGFRRTSMDQLAQAADVAKPTLYAYFDDKQAVFSAVVDDVLSSIMTDATAAASQAGPLERRLSAVLDAKFTRMFELVHSSPHAAELLESSETTSAETTARTDESYRSLLLDIVSAASRAGEIDLRRARVTRAAFVDALLLAGHGASYGASTAVENSRNVRSQVHLLVAAVHPG